MRQLKIEMDEKFHFLIGEEFGGASERRCANAVRARPAGSSALASTHPS
jgi:hypothetical protein